MLYYFSHFQPICWNVNIYIPISTLTLVPTSLVERKEHNLRNPEEPVKISYESEMCFPSFMCSLPLYTKRLWPNCSWARMMVIRNSAKIHQQDPDMGSWGGGFHMRQFRVTFTALSNCRGSWREVSDSAEAFRWPHCYRSQGDGLGAIKSCGLYCFCFWGLGWLWRSWNRLIHGVCSEV